VGRAKRNLTLCCHSSPVNSRRRPPHDACVQQARAAFVRRPVLTYRPCHARCLPLPSRVQLHASHSATLPYKRRHAYHPNSSQRPRGFGERKQAITGKDQWTREHSALLSELRPSKRYKESIYTSKHKLQQCGEIFSPRPLYLFDAQTTSAGTAALHSQLGRLLQSPYAPRRLVTAPRPASSSTLLKYVGS
jgi:hypothetical protein